MNHHDLLLLNPFLKLKNDSRMFVGEIPHVNLQASNACAAGYAAAPAKPGLRIAEA